MRPVRVTVNDVARAAGVHASTVSRAVNPQTRGMVTEEVAERVLAVARALGYRPNGVAASLRTRRSFTVGVVLPDITNAVFPPILRGIESALDRDGYVAMVANAGADGGRLERVVDRLQARQVDGLILATVSRHDPVVDACLAQGLPLVLVNRTEVPARVSAVVSDDALGMQLAVDHLWALGHRRIAHLAGPPGLSTGLRRSQGFRAAVAAHDPSATPAVVAAAGYARDAGRAACAALLAEAPALTAIVAANDLIALGCYDALAAAGRRCPEDVSVVGHNDMPLVDMIAPPLTTVRIRHREMGLEAARLLLRRIEDGPGPAIEVVLKPELVVRASTAAPRART